MKGEACEERRNDSYLSCLLGPERQARTEERNGHCFRQVSGPLMTWGALWDLWHPYGIHEGRGRDCQDPGGSGKEHSGCGGHSSGPHSQVSMPWTRTPCSIHPGRREPTLQEGGTGSRSGVRDQGLGAGERWGTEHRNIYMETCSHTQTNICSLTSVH